jgi:hypothetical protein
MQGRIPASSNNLSGMSVLDHFVKLFYVVESAPNRGVRAVWGDRVSDVSPTPRLLPPLAQ